LARVFKFSSSPLKLDLHNFFAFSKTRAPQLHSPSSSDPTAESSGHVGHWCPAHHLHALESLLLFEARDGHAPLSLAMHGVGWGLQWLIYYWVVQVTARVRHASLSPTESAVVSTANSLFLVFSCFVLCIPLVSSDTSCLCIAQILLEFLLARC